MSSQFRRPYLNDRYRGDLVAEETEDEVDDAYQLSVLMAVNSRTRGYPASCLLEISRQGR